LAKSLKAGPIAAGTTTESAVDTDPSTTAATADFFAARSARIFAMRSSALLLGK
jgi:hypothetical protein